MLAVAAFCLLIGFVRLARSRPTTLRRWVATCSILIVHCQTLSLIGQLGLMWPPRVQALLDFLALHGLNLPSVSCWVPVPDSSGQYDIAPSTIYATSLAGVALGLLVLPAASLIVLDGFERLCARYAATAALLECVLTLIATLLFTFTLGAVADAFATLGEKTSFTISY